MKIYVDELPECCSKCPCMNDDIDFGNHCNIICVNDLKLFLDWDDCQSFRHKDCPLETTQSLKQQVKEEVVEEIKEKLKEKAIFHPEDEFEIDYNFYYEEDVEEILDQVKGENNAKD